MALFHTQVSGKSTLWRGALTCPWICLGPFFLHGLPKFFLEMTELVASKRATTKIEVFILYNIIIKIEHISSVYYIIILNA